MYLELNRKALNSATRAELGRLPVQITLVKKTLKYYSYLCAKDENTIAKQAFLIAKELDLENRKSYISEIKSYLRETESKNHETLEPLSNSSIAQVLKNIENNYLKFWQGEITASKKLDFYRKFKQDFSVSSYIYILRNRGTRKSFVKFYLSNHKLCIESGRHRRPVLPREERVCAVCKNNEIEDETHTVYTRVQVEFFGRENGLKNRPRLIFGRT